MKSLIIYQPHLKIETTANPRNTAKIVAALGTVAPGRTITVNDQGSGSVYRFLITKRRTVRESSRYIVNQAHEPSLDRLRAEAEQLERQYKKSRCIADKALADLVWSRLIRETCETYNVRCSNPVGVDYDALPDGARWTHTAQPYEVEKVKGQDSDNLPYRRQVVVWYTDAEWEKLKGQAGTR